MCYTGSDGLLSFALWQSQVKRTKYKNRIFLKHGVNLISICFGIFCSVRALVLVLHTIIPSHTETISTVIKVGLIYCWADSLGPKYPTEISVPLASALPLPDFALLVPCTAEGSFVKCIISWSDGLILTQLNLDNLFNYWWLSCSLQCQKCAAAFVREPLSDTPERPRLIIWGVTKGELRPQNLRGNFLQASEEEFL